MTEVERLHIERPAWPDPEGELVRFSDYEALRAELEAVKAEQEDFRSCLATTSGKLMAAEARVEQLEAENGRLLEALVEISEGCTGRVDKDNLACRIARAALTGREG